MAERIRIKDIAKMADVSVGTVDRVIHGRSGVSEASRKRVEEILKQLDYQPNMYASALASNKKYAFSCLLPQHEEGEYWTAVEAGIHDALIAYSDFNISVDLSYYDPFDYPGTGTGRRHVCPHRAAAYEIFHRGIEPTFYTLYIYRLKSERSARPFLLWTEFSPKRILRRKNDDATCRK